MLGPNSNFLFYVGDILDSILSWWCIFKRINLVSSKAYISEKVSPDFTLSSLYIF